MASRRSNQEELAAVSSDPTTPAGDTVVLTDESLSRIVDSLGNIYFRLGVLLQLTRPEISQLEVKFPGDLWRLNFEVLATWRDNNLDLPNMVNDLIQALRSLELNDVVETVRDEYVKLLRLKITSHGKELKERQDEVCRLKEAPKTEKQRKTTEVCSHNLQQCLLVVGGITEKKKNGEGWESYKLCHFWEEGRKCWELLTEVPQSVDTVYDVCQVACDQLLLTGGSNGGVAQGSCWLLHTVTKTWTQLPSLTMPRKYHRSGHLGDCVIVVGGEDVNDKVIGSVEQLDLKRRQWSSLPDIPQPVSDPTVTSHGHRLYVFGGRDADDKALSCTQAYDTTSGQWLTLSATPKVCDLGAAVSLGTYIYLVGGFRQICLRYDPATDGWTVLREPRLEHGNGPAVMWQCGILVAGGGDGNVKRSAEIELYDPVRDEWTDWRTPLKVKLDSNRMFSVILSGV